MKKVNVIASPAKRGEAILLSICLIKSTTNLLQLHLGVRGQEKPDPLNPTPQTLSPTPQCPLIKLVSSINEPPWITVPTASLNTATIIATSSLLTVQEKVIAALVVCKAY